MPSVCLVPASVAQRVGREVPKLVVGSSTPLLAIVTFIIGGIFASYKQCNFCLFSFFQSRFLSECLFVRFRRAVSSSRP